MRRKVASLVALALVGALVLGASAPALAQERAVGQGSYLLGPGLPTVFTFDRDSMSCAVSWGTLGAPGPGPFTDPKMKLDKVNFGMVVYSLKVTSFQVADRRVIMKGQARSITTVNDQIVENVVYSYEVEAVDGGPPAKDSFRMTLKGKGLMFDEHAFGPVAGTGLTGGDVVIRR